MHHGITKAYEVVLLHHLRNSRGPKGTPLEFLRHCEAFFELFFTKKVNCHKDSDTCTDNKNRF